jgi:predicted transcriptional regulator
MAYFFLALLILFIIGVVFFIKIIKKIGALILGAFFTVIANYRTAVNLISGVFYVMIFIEFMSAPDFFIRALLVVGAIGGVAGFFIINKADAKEFYADMLFRFECAAAILSFVLFMCLGVPADKSAFWAIGISLPASLSVGLVAFPLDRAVFNAKYSDKRLLALIEKTVEPVTTSELIERLKINKSRQGYICERLREFSENGEIIEAENYLYGKHEFDKLVSSVEVFLLVNGGKDAEEISNHIAGASTKRFYIQNALRVLLKNGVITETQVNASKIKILAGLQSERYVYAHKNNPLEKTQTDTNGGNRGLLERFFSNFLR